MARLSATEATAGSEISRILGQSQRYRLFCLNGAVVVRDTAAPGPAWLSRKVPLFKCPKATVKLASSGLQLQVEALLNPSQTGYLGSIPDSFSASIIGPYIIKGATVRSLLCRLVGDLKGAMWIVPPTSEAFGDSMNDGLWTIVQYPSSAQLIPDSSQSH